MRAAYAKTRNERKHGEDAFLRAQYDARRSARGLETKTKTPSAMEISRGEREGKGVDAEVVRRAMRAGIEYYRGIQDEDGHWASDYGGPMFLMPGLIIAANVMEKSEEIIGEARGREMLRYLENHTNEDGGVGLHIEGHSTMFGTVLTYVAMRLLGKAADSPECAKTRKWIIDRGGATQVPSWGKFWLAVLGVYEWHGLNPIPPECWLLPYWLPMHPGRFWCHCRMVYLPMSYLYGIRATGKPTALTAALKSELYAEASYDSINWNTARNACAKEDLYYPHPWIQDVLWSTLMKVEPFLMNSRLRKAACADAMRQIHYEDENTRYVDIGPVNKVFNMLSCWFEDPDSEAVKKHIPRIADYLWVAEDGMKMQGYNGSQLWDCAFSVQAIVATGLADEYSECLRRAHDYIEKSQVRDDCPDVKKWYRHISKGAWPFSTRDHGWPISDCSSEGLKAALTLASMDEKLVGEAIPVEPTRGLRERHPILSKSRQWWLGYVRKYSIDEMGRALEPSGDVRGHHDRLPVRRVLEREFAGAVQIFRALSGHSCQGYRARQEDWPKVFEKYSTRRWKLVRIVGGVLHVRNMVRRPGIDRHGFDVRDVSIAS